jgi:hypothetical protein
LAEAILTNAVYRFRIPLVTFRHTRSIISAKKRE